MRGVAICDRSSQDKQTAPKTQALQAPWGGPEIRRGEVPPLTSTSLQLTKDAQGGNLGTGRCWGSRSGRRERDSFVALVALSTRPRARLSLSRATSSTRGRTVVVEGCGVQASAPRRRSCLMRSSLAETGTTDGRRYCAPGHSRARNSQKCPLQQLRIERVRRRRLM
jgi:hypothetical protein